jgi:hypothetical protein
VTPQAGTIGSNLKEATRSYDEELSLTPQQLAYLDTLERNDRNLSNEELEEIDRQYTLAYASAEPSRWNKQELWQGNENEAMRLVNILHPHAVFRKLQAAGVDARIEAAKFWTWVIDDSTGMPTVVRKEHSTGRLWLHDDAVRGRVGVSAWVYENGEKKRRCVTSLQDDCGPEWSVMRFNEWNVPTTEKYRGWRTAMLHLILAGVLTEEEVDRAFGPPVDNDASWFYRRSLEDYRKQRGRQ